MLTQHKTLLVASALGLTALFLQADAQAQVRVSGLNIASSSFRLMPAPTVRNSGDFNRRLPVTRDLGAARSGSQSQQDPR